MNLFKSCGLLFALTLIGMPVYADLHAAGSTLGTIGLFSGLKAAPEGGSQPDTIFNCKVSNNVTAIRLSSRNVLITGFDASGKFSDLGKLKGSAFGAAQDPKVKGQDGSLVLESIEPSNGTIKCESGAGGKPVLMDTLQKR